jgi:hypothetical protein
MATKAKCPDAPFWHILRKSSLVVPRPQRGEL